MDTTPHTLTPQEWQELLPIAGQSWGAQTAEELADVAYGVRFAFISSGPGYAGDLFILAGDELDKPLVVIRDKDGALSAL